MRIRHAASVVAVGLLVSLILSTQGLAQTSPGYYPRANYPQFPAGGGRGYGGYGYGGGGTAAGSYLNGMANVVRSAGYANVMNSVAAQNYEQAYSYDLDNRLKATNTYFEMKRVNQAARAESRSPPPTADELARYAAEAAPKRLTSSQLDPVTGEINWPAVLGDPRYADQRAAVERLFSQRQATTGGAGDYRAIVDAIETLGKTLRNNIQDYSPAVYIDGSKFLDSLKYEARFVTS